MGTIPHSIQDVIRLKAATEWPDDFEMQLYVFDQQTSAYFRLASFNHSGVPDHTLALIKKNAVKEWENDFEMQLYFIETQTDAYISLYGRQDRSDPSVIADLSLTAAAEEWPDDFEMQRHVTEEEADARPQNRSSAQENPIDSPRSQRSNPKFSEYAHSPLPSILEWH